MHSKWSSRLLRCFSEALLEGAPRAESNIKLARNVTVLVRKLNLGPCDKSDGNADDNTDGTATWPRVAPTPEQVSSLIFAVCSGDIETVLAAVENNLDVNNAVDERRQK